jgi:hypothetical protein
MAASISTLSILLTGSAAGLVSAFAQGGQSADEFGQHISEVGSRVGEIFAGLGIAIGGEQVVEWLKDAAGRVGELSLKATELGISTESLSRLQFAAKETGVSAEQLSTAFVKMENNLEKGAQGSKAQAEAFERLGLNAGELARLAPDQAFNKIADAIAKLQSPQERINAEMAVFGKSGAALGPLLREGSGGIEKMGEEADKLGVTLNDVDAAKVLEANRSVAQLGDIVEGVGNQVLVELAPIITDVSSRLKKWLEDGRVVKKGLDAVWTGIGYGAGFVAEVLKIGEADFDAMAAAGTASLYLIIKQFDELAHVGSWVWEKLFGTSIDTSAIDAVVDDLAARTMKLASSAAANAVDAYKGTTAATWMEYLDTLKAEADKRAKDSVATPGTAHESLLDKLHSKSKGLLNSLIKFGEEGWKKISKAAEEAAKKAAEESKKLDNEAHHLLESAMTPLEKEREKLAEIDKLYKSGHLTKAQDEMLKSRVEIEFNKDVNLTPKAVTANSQEAFGLMAQIQQRIAGGGKEGVEKDQLEEAKKQTGYLRTIALARGHAEKVVRVS